MFSKHTHHYDQDSPQAHIAHLPSTNEDKSYQSPSRHLDFKELKHTIHPENVIREGR